MVYDKFRSIDTIDMQIKRAESAINDLEMPLEKEWFKDLLRILQTNHCARIVGLNGKFLDVSKIAYSCAYASFFDIYNSKRLFDMNIKPIMIAEFDGLNKTIYDFYGHEYYV